MGHTPSKAFRIRVFLFSAFSGDLAAIGMGDGRDQFAFERCLPGAAAPVAETGRARAAPTCWLGLRKLVRASPPAGPLPSCSLRSLLLSWC